MSGIIKTYIKRGAVVAVQNVNYLVRSAAIILTGVAMRVICVVREASPAFILRIDCKSFSPNSSSIIVFRSVIFSQWLQ